MLEHEDGQLPTLRTANLGDSGFMVLRDGVRPIAALATLCRGFGSAL
jgi:hypothetical protein